MTSQWDLPGDRRVRRSWPILLVILSVPLTITLGLASCRSVMDDFATGILVSTLVTIVWYTYETRLLRLHQESDAELRNFAWLDVLSPELSELAVRSAGNEIEAWTLRFTLRNNGVTPAYDIRIVSKWSISARSQTLAALPSVEKEEEHGIGFIPPHSTSEFHVVVRLDADLSRRENVRNMVVELCVVYRTFQGGRGTIQYKLERLNPSGEGSEGEEKWHSFTLADGTSFPVGTAVSMGGKTSKIGRHW